jgi:hypothetical protein
MTSCSGLARRAHIEAEPLGRPPRGPNRRQASPSGVSVPGGAVGRSAEAAFAATPLTPTRVEGAAQAAHPPLSLDRTAGTYMGWRNRGFGSGRACRPAYRAPRRPPRTRPPAAEPVGMRPATGALVGHVAGRCDQQPIREFDLTNVVLPLAPLVVALDDHRRLTRERNCLEQVTRKQDLRPRPTPIELVFWSMSSACHGPLPRANSAATP